MVSGFLRSSSTLLITSWWSRPVTVPGASLRSNPKASLHFFWGSFDLAVTRFSGRVAPPHPGGIPHLPDAITREAYSQEVSSLGFWPGNDALPQALFYSYAYPEPQSFAQRKVKPDGATYNAQLREFILPYDIVRQAELPDDVLLDFAESTYDAASILSKWDRAALVEQKPDLLSSAQRP